MDFIKDAVKFISLIKTIILAILKKIKNKEEGFINGIVVMVIYMKENFKTVKEMEKVYFYGPMEADMKVFSKMVYKMVLGLCIEKMEVNNMKEIGQMECSMVREYNISRQDKYIVVILSKINFMGKVLFIRKIQLLRGHGNRTN